MKKLFLAFVTVALCLGFAGTSMAATEIKAKGTFDFGFGLYSGTSFVKHDGQDNFDAAQMLRTQIDFIASENLKGVAYFEVGTIYWGNGGGATYGWGSSAGRGAGGAMGADGVNIEVKNLYIDWNVPQTDLQVRMGIQYFALPTAVLRADGGGNAIIDDDLAGLLLSYNVNENFGVNLGWFRPWDPFIYGSDQGNTLHAKQLAQHDSIDMFVLTLPIEVKQEFSFTPWAMYASVGQADDSWDPDAMGTPFEFSMISSYLSNNGVLGPNGNVWWSGFAFNLEHFDPFIASLDFMYGSYSADRADGKYYSNMTDPDRSGWAVIGKLAYKLDYLTPAIVGWYASGSDDNELYGGLLPTLAPYFGPTSYGFSSASARNCMMREWTISDSVGGTWGIGLALEDIKVIDNLTSQLRFFYYQGTNDFESRNRDLVKSMDTHTFSEFRLMGKNDHAIEINFDNVYNIYENLDLFLDLGYIKVSLDDEPSNFESNAWKSYIGFQYSF